jgi:hypothetical protein
MKSDKVALLPKILLVISLGLFVTCLAYDSFCVEGNRWPGFGALLLGLGGLLVPSPGNLTWLANPLLFASWIAVLNGSGKVAIRLSLAALAFSALFLVARTVIGEKGPMDITCLGPGYWLWLASIAAANISAFVTYLAVSRLATVSDDE